MTDGQTSDKVIPKWRSASLVPQKREILLSRYKEWRQPNIGLCYRLNTAKGISVNLQEQDKSSDIEQQPPFGDVLKQTFQAGGIKMIQKFTFPSIF